MIKLTQDYFGQISTGLVVHIGLRTHLSLLVQVPDEVMKLQINAAAKKCQRWPQQPAQVAF
jgi:hypothetical protein